jgi:hypothetical protein
VELGDVATWSAALVAIAAAAVSWGGVVAARRSARADEGMLHKEQTPTFKGLVEDQNGDIKGYGGTPVLMLQLTGPHDIDSLQIELRTEGATFPPGQHGVEPGAPRRVAVHAPQGVPSGMAVGDKMKWRLKFDQIDAGPKAYVPVEMVEVLVHATRGKGKRAATWKMMVEVPIEARQKHAELKRTTARGLGRYDL